MKIAEQSNKPFRGEINNWWKSPCSELSLKYYKDHGIKNLGYVICGDIKGHPYIPDSRPNRGNFQTSLVINKEFNQESQVETVETLNSIYKLMNPRAKESLTP